MVPWRRKEKYYEKNIIKMVSWRRKENIMKKRYNGKSFKDGNTEALMGVFKFKDGKVISFETGATKIPK